MKLTILVKRSVGHDHVDMGVPQHLEAKGLNRSHDPESMSHQGQNATHLVLFSRHNASVHSRGPDCIENTTGTASVS